MNFEISYIGHSRNARNLIVKDKIKPLEEVAYLSDTEVTRIINDNYVVLGYDEDWELVKKEDYQKIARLIRLINR